LRRGSGRFTNALRISKSALTSNAYVVVFASVNDAIRALRPSKWTIVDPSLRHRRVRNVVVEWHGTRDPGVAPVIKDLR